MQIRTPLQIQADVLFALFIQDIRERFSHFTLGSIWFLVEPMIFVSMFIVIFGMRGRGEFGGAEPPVFIAAGMIPFMLLFQITMKNMVTAPNQARRYMSFRQIQVTDLIMVKAVTQLFLFFTVTTIILGIFAWIGMSPFPHRPLELITIFLYFWFAAIGFGLIVMRLASFAPEIAAFVNLLTFPLKILSGAIVPFTMIEEPYRSILAYNPLAHHVELIREYWFRGYVSPIADWSYMIAWSVLLFGLGLIVLKQHIRRNLA